MLLTPTGGLIYHLRAMRHQRRQWAEFRENLYKWLETWRPTESSLLLIGPSGGYCLDRRFVSRFTKVAAVDPDRLSRWILPWRFRRSVAWSSRDYFSPRASEFDIEGVRSLLADYPDHAILFCNFLGQIPFLDTDAALGDSFARWKRDLNEVLADRSWASFHDRLSGPLAPALSQPEGDFPLPLTDSELLDKLYHRRTGSPGNPERPVELLDHLTGDLFPGLPRRYLSWRLTPNYWHLIECVAKVASKQTRNS
jgi:hypothetical protein